MVMGLGVSRFWWPQGLVDELISRGFHVVAFDQRDAADPARAAILLAAAHRMGDALVQGAAGIAAFLFRLARVGNGDPGDPSGPGGPGGLRAPVVGLPDQWWAVRTGEPCQTFSSTCDTKVISSSRTESRSRASHSMTGASGSRSRARRMTSGS